MLIKLADILSNPFRDLDRNPLVPAKVEELRASIRQTGYWDNVVVRKNADGRYELAYGHHRLEAAKLEGITEADFIVKKFDDATMIKVMNAENSEAYGYSILSLIEAVRATVNALAEKRIPAFIIPDKTPKASIRYAPSFTPGNLVSGGEFPPHAKYAPIAIAKFLGYTDRNGQGKETADNNVQAALRALYLIEAGVYTEAQLKDWNVSQLLKNTQQRFDLLMEQRKREKVNAEAEAERLRIEQEQKAFKEEREAEAKAAKDKQKELLEKQREAEKAENEKAAAEAAEKRKRAEENEKLRTLKAHATAAQKALTRYGANSVEEGAAIELAVHQANTVLEAKDTAEAEKITEKLSKLSRKVTDKFLEQQKAEQEAADVVRKEMPTRNAVKALHSALLRIASEEDPLQDRIKTLARNPVVTIKERDLLFHAVEDAQDRLGRLKKYFAKVGKVDVLAEAYKKEDAKRKLSGEEAEEELLVKPIRKKKVTKKKKGAK
jgi:hypothetical protein